MIDIPGAQLITGLHFAEPQWAQLLWAVAVYVALLAWMERSRTDALDRFVSSALQPQLVASPSAAQRISHIIFLGLFGVFMTIALMRPQWGLETVESHRTSAEIMVCLDVSRSMLAEDVTPNRLERAKTELLDLLELIEHDQVGLIAFAGRASVLSPLTPDFGFLRLSLKNALPQSIGRGGTRLEEPIRRAIDGFGATTGVARSILLITDGEDHDSFPMAAAKLAAERGIRILAIGFGDEAGAEIPLTDPSTGARSSLKDADGRLVSSRLDGDLLREMALLTDGAYIPAGTGLLDLGAIYRQHIAPLTRGQVKTQTRTARKDAFQWLVMAGLLCLLGAVLSNARATRPQSALGGAAPLLLIGALGTVLSSPPVRAQAAQLSSPPAVETPGGQERSSKVPSQPIPEDARQAYNQGLDKLRADRPAVALQYFQAARNRAGTDHDVRLRATYNAGWAEVSSADAAREESPDAALEHLRKAASWFREAIKLQKNFESARFNLELVLRRANELADALATKEPSDIEARLEKLIRDQRSFLASLGQTLEGAGPAGGKELRRQYRRAAGLELVILADAEAVSDTAVRDSRAIAALDEAERSPEKALRLARLEAALRHLHNARERLGQTRSRLRKQQGTRAYRRAAAAMSALNRARDQFLEPAERLDSLLADGSETTQLTAAYATGRAAARSLTTPSTNGLETIPAWLTPRFLEQGQKDLGERLGELAAEFEAGLEAMQNQSAANPSGPNDTAAGAQAKFSETRRRSLIQSLRRSSPAIGEAARMAGLALARLQEGDFDNVPAAQRDSLTALAEAREAFLGLRQLIELVHGEQRRTARMLGLAKETPDPDADEAAIPPQPNWPPEQWFSYAGAVHSRNVERAIRLSEKFTEQMTEKEQIQPAPGPSSTAESGERLNKGYAILGEALDEMHQTSAAFERYRDVESKLDAKLVGNASDATLAALRKLDELRRLFFTLLQHLRETAKRQRVLNDQTVALATLSAQNTNTSVGVRSGPLSHRQAALSKTASDIGQSLEVQAQAPTGDESGNAQQDQERQAQKQGQSRVFADAAALVSESAVAMRGAAKQLRPDPPGFDPARPLQDEALQKLLAALDLLQRSRDQQGEEDNPQAEQNEDQKHSQSQPQQSGQPERRQSENVEQLLQGVRDREARRRQERSALRTIGGREPVAKDW